MFFLFPQVLHFLEGPYREVTAGRNGCPASDGCKLIATGPLEPFLVRLKVVDLRRHRARRCPFVFWQIWRFVTPGAAQERTPLRRSGSSSRSSCCSSLGAVVAWFTVEKALEFLLGVGRLQIQPFITADKYLTLVTLMIARVRRRVRVPGAPRVPVAGPGREHPPAPRTSGAG